LPWLGAVVWIAIAVCGALGAAPSSVWAADAGAAKTEGKAEAKTGTKTVAKTAAKPAKVDPTSAAAAAASEKSGPATPAPAGSSPMAELKKSNLALDKALSKNRPNWSPEAELQRAEVRKIVGGFLDYGELAHRSLGRHWEPLTPRQREEFVATLRELVERSYLRQVHGNAAYNIKYDKEEKAPGGSEASVTATLNTMARGKKVVIAMEYKMLYKDAHWVVYDVLTDDQSMLENYRAEFNKIITKESFDALLKKMKKKLDEKEE
jgi:phospholipid transport system substrate-binding protein